MSGYVVLEKLLDGLEVDVASGAEEVDGMGVLHVILHVVCESFLIDEEPLAAFVPCSFVTSSCAAMT